MTTSKRAERERRELLEGAAPGSLEDLVGRELRARRGAIASIAPWPDARWQSDPVGFMRTILGFEPWMKQKEIAQLAVACIEEGLRLAVKSGHKIGKSTICAALALWAYCCFPGVRVVLTAVTSRQVDGIIWREIRMLLANHGRCVECKRKNPHGPRPCPHSKLIEGEPGQLARTGLKAVDFREIVGFTAKEAEAVAGVSGPFIVYICDEASGIPALIYQAIEGNRAGGALVILIGNPTKLSGEFFDAFHVKKDKFYKTLTVSSEESPNVVARKKVVPGLAELSWILEKRREWGEKSPIYLVRVKGEFPENEKGAVFPPDLLQAAIERWEETPAEGSLLAIGVDVAGPSGAGDSSGFASRRGRRVQDVYTRLGITADQHLIEVLGLIAKRRERNDRVRVVIDREGEDGSKVWGVFVSYLAQKEHEGEFELVGVRASERAKRDPRTFDRVRDELAANLADWLEEGGALPDDGGLQTELGCFRWADFSVTGRTKLEPKDRIREILGRSPDKGDAVALSVWGEHLELAPVEERRGEVKDTRGESGFDPYVAQATGTDGEGGFDPYSA